MDALLDAGHNVTVLDDLSVGKVAELRPPPRPPPLSFRARFYPGCGLLKRLAADVDGIYHLAAVVGVKYVVEDPLRGMHVNLHGTENVLEAALERRCKVVIASSSEAFGKSVQVPFKEEDNTVLGPTSVSRWSYATLQAAGRALRLRLPPPKGPADGRRPLFQHLRAATRSAWIRQRHREVHHASPNRRPDHGLRRR